MIVVGNNIIQPPVHSVIIDELLIRLGGSIMPKAKRRDGEGTIVKYIEHGVCKGWRAAIVTIYVDGYKRKEFYTQTQSEIKTNLDKYKNDMELGVLPIDDGITLKEWYYLWLWEYRIQDLKPKTFEMYESIYRNYIKDSEIGDIKLKDLRTVHLQKYYNNLRINRGKPASLIRKLNTRLKTCLGYAEKQEYIDKNYCKLVTLPRCTRTRHVEILSAENQKKFIKAIKGHKLEMIFLVALSTGARLGELLALKWSDIDFETGVMTIKRTLSRARNPYTGLFETLEQSPKTENGVRSIPIPSAIVSRLKVYRETQANQKLLMGELYIDRDYVFTDEIGKPLDDKRPGRNLKSILNSIGVPPIKFHALRHTYATRLFEAKVQPKTVQVLMGHTDIKITMNIYTHVMNEAKVEAVESLNNIFSI